MAKFKVLLDERAELFFLTYPDLIEDHRHDVVDMVRAKGGSLLEGPPERRTMTESPWTEYRHIFYEYPAIPKQGP